MNFLNALNGLTDAGRALQKHGNRPGSSFPAAKGNPSAINTQGETALKNILNSSDATFLKRHHARFGDILEVKLPSG